MTPSLHLILLGVPGAGKGTQAQFIVEQWNTAHISTGEILRAAVKNGTELGKMAQEHMHKGNLVPDSLVLDIIRETLTAPTFSPDWMMDGFPRNLAQAEAFDNMLKEIHQELTAVLNVDVPLDLIIERLVYRYSCRNCSAAYNLKLNPPQSEGVCDQCGGELYQRKDDQRESVENRLKVYQEQTQPLIDYYESRQLLLTVNGNQSIEKVKAEIYQLLTREERVR